MTVIIESTNLGREHRTDRYGQDTLGSAALYFAYADPNPDAAVLEAMAWDELAYATD